MTTDPIAFYTFNNIAPPIVFDDSGNNYDATMVNSPSIVPGVIGTALEYDPALIQYCDAGGRMANSLGNNVPALSVSFWFKANEISTKGLFNISLFDGSNGEFAVFLHATNNIRLRFSNGSFSEDTPFSDITNWHHIVAQYTGSKGQLFLDNSLIINENHSTNLNLTGLKTLVGIVFSADVNPAFDGKIDQVRVFDRELSPAEINTLYQEGVVGMADKRSVFNIPANTWVKVINGATAAKIRKGASIVNYYSMAFDSGADTPIDQSVFDTETAEKIFVKDIDEVVSDSAAVYTWLRCAPDEVGSVIVTL